MKQASKLSLRNIFRQVKAEGLSMRRRFIFYIISTIAFVLSLVMFLLNLSGIINHANSQIMEALDTHLASYADNIVRDYNKAAAHAISFSDQLETEIQNYLTDNGLSFNSLKNNADALSDLQCYLYDTVYLNMQLAPASGAFYILDTTVNTHSKTPLFNGIYLKYVNLYSTSTVNNEITLYRGSFSTASEGNLTFHSGWNNEMQTDFFEHCDLEFSDGIHYILSPTVEIPDTWERARYVYVPIHDAKENIIGVCGFEINDLFFQLSKKATDDKYGQFTGALLDEEEGICSGQFDTGRYNTLSQGSVSLTVKSDHTLFDFGTERGIGQTKRVVLGKDTFTVALIMSEAKFDSFVQSEHRKTTLIILAVVLVMLAYCLFVSKKYVSPILKKINQIKHSEDDGEQVKIPEIDDLFAYFEERSTVHEEQINALTVAKEAAEADVIRTKEAYENALKKFELAQNELLRLSEENKNEIVLEDYEYFVCNLKTLTPREYNIYELYLEGKSTSEIAQTIGIKENTMKYHNKNIYGKLGVSSRKQLLRFAALKQYRDKQNG